MPYVIKKVKDYVLQIDKFWQVIQITFYDKKRLIFSNRIK